MQDDLKSLCFENMQS